MKKIFNKIKNYHPSKYVWYLYLFIPIFIGFITRMDRENDIFFLLKYGEHVLNSGFPTVDFLSMHQNFSFIMQQWLSSVIFYVFYGLLGHYGLLIIVNIVNILILFMLYRFCMLLSDNNYKISIILSCVTDLLLETSFMVPRPQIFDYLILIIVMYIMELFYRNKSSKVLLWLPLLSLIQINLHASTWIMIFLFMLPYVVSLCYEKLIDHNDKRIYKVLGIMMIMFLVGFLNPYGIDNILYLTTSYGNKYINNLVIEMLPPTLSIDYNIYGLLTFFLMGCVLYIYIDYKKEKLSLRYGLLLLGVTILALSHIRNLSLYAIGAISPLALFLKNVLKPKIEQELFMDQKYKRNYIIIIIFMCVYTIIMAVMFNNKFTNRIKGGVDYLLKNNKKEDIVLYTNYNNGSYSEFRGLKPYIDARAEIFVKLNNKKEDIIKEYYLLSNDHIDYKGFLKKYNFTHLIVDIHEPLYQHLLSSKDYKIIYNEKDYAIFEKI